MRERNWMVVLLAGMAAATQAYASDKPLTTPMPAWVRPVVVPTAPPATGDVPITFLLSDQQVRFERGRIVTFVHTVLRINTAQGLAIGNLSLPWRPDVGDLEVHRLAIRRGDAVTDVLKSGQTFSVLRRETNLESAMFDGVLTANIQPEGLQVGDVLDFAVSISVSDPVVAGHVEQGVAIGTGLPIARAHFAASWPRDLPLRLQVDGPLPTLKPIRDGDREMVEWNGDAVQPLIPPKGVPLRYQIGRVVEMSDFESWSAVGALMAPLYAKAAVVPASGPLADEVAHIRAASADPAARTMAALALVQGRIRYVALAMGAGGLVPADAAETWSRRFGDCKAKTALLLAILHALDIPAEPVVVASRGGDGVDGRLPSIGAFDHVLVRATVAGRPVWLDGTRIGDTGFDRLTVPAVGWGLPLVPRNAALVRMVPPPLARPANETEMAIDATNGLTVPAPVTVDQIWRGDAAIGLNAMLANLVGDVRERSLRDWWKRQYDFIDVDRTDTRYDPATGEMHIAMRGKARMDWSTGWYETDGLSLGYKPDFARDPGPNRDAPYAVDYPAYSRVIETIRLPVGFPDHAVPDKMTIDRTVGGVEYHRHGAIEARVFRGEATMRSVAPEFPASEAAATEAALRDMAANTVYLRRPADYHLTDAELTATKTNPPTSVDGLLRLGYSLSERGQMVEAIAAYDAVLKLDPANETALANRALMHAYRDERTAAAADMAAAKAINPRNPIAIHAGMALAARDHKYQEVIDLAAIALQIDPHDLWALGQRIQAERAVAKPEAALADVDAAMALKPADVRLVLLRVNVLRGLGRSEDALATIRAGTAVAPNDAFMHVAAANTYAAMGRHEDMMREFDRALAIKPEGYIYLNRAQQRPPSDVAGRRADLTESLKLDPRSGDALAAMAELKSRTGDLTGAIADYDAVMAVTPDRPEMIAGRGVAEWRSGRRVDAERDFAAARLLATKAGALALNNLCWTKATAGIALDSALADCDAAVASEPAFAAAIDSRGFVLLRLGRFAEAIASYSKALSIAPTMAASLYGRGVAYRKAGDAARAKADLDAAAVVEPNIADRFREYGVTPS